MTKEQVSASLGEPDHTFVGSGMTEYMIYRGNKLFVRLTDGKVDAYGTINDGDFGSSDKYSLKHSFDI